VVGICRAVVFLLVTAHTSVGRVVVISTVTGSAVVGYGGVGAFQYIIIIVVGKSRRVPVGLRGVTTRTIGAQPQCNVVGVARLIEVVGMAARAGVGRIGIIPTNMTGRAIIGNQRMATRERKEIVVIETRRRPSAFTVATLTIGGELSSLVVGVGSVVEIRQMASHTSVGRVVVIAVVTGRAVVGNGSVRSIQFVEIIVVGKSRRRPAGLGGMATRTIGAQPQCNVVGVARLIEVVGMAARAGVGRIGIIPTNVAGRTIISNQRMATRERKEIVVIETRRRPGAFTVATLTIGGELSSLVVGIGRVVVLGQMASHASVGRVVVIAVVTGRAVVGNGSVRAVERVEIIVVGKSRRRPAGLGGMATRTVGAQSQRDVVGIARLIEIVGMAARAGVGRVGIIPTNVASRAIIGNQRVAAREREEIVVIETRRRPGAFAVATLTIGGELSSLVVGIGRVVVIRQMASHASVGRVVVIAVVTGRAVVGNGSVRAVEGVEIIVVGKSRRRPAGLGGMATRTVGAQSQRDVVGIARLIEIVGMAARAGVGRVGIIPTNVASRAIIGNQRVAAREREEIVVIETRRRPGAFAVATLTIGGELSSLVVGIGSVVVIRQMASHASVGRVVVIPVVTGRAVVGNGSVRAVEGVEIIVVGKSRRRPTGLGGMATRTVGAQSQRDVVGIARLIEIVGMAARAGGRRTFITRCVTV